MIHARTLIKKYGPMEPIYTFVAHDGTNTNIASRLLRDWCLDNQPEILLIPVDRALAKTFIRDNVVSYQRVKELLPRKHLDPIIYCKDGKYTDGRPDCYLADGHHRYVLAAALNRDFIRAHMLEMNEWRRFQVVGLPDITKEVLKAYPISKRNY